MYKQLHKYSQLKPFSKKKNQFAKSQQRDVAINNAGIFNSFRFLKHVESKVLSFGLVYSVHKFVCTGFCFYILRSPESLR